MELPKDWETCELPVSLVTDPDWETKFDLRQMIVAARRELWERQRSDRRRCNDAIIDHELAGRPISVRLRNVLHNENVTLAGAHILLDKEIIGCGKVCKAELRWLLATPRDQMMVELADVDVWPI